MAWSRARKSGLSRRETTVEVEAPAVIATPRLLKNRQKHFVIDGEAVVLGVDGNANFNDLHSRKHDHEVQLYAFDILALGGDDPRSLPLHLRKQNSRSYWRAALTASRLHHSSAARSGRTCFAPPAGWALKDLYPSIANGPIAAAARRTGLRRRTATIRPSNVVSMTTIDLASDDNLPQKITFGEMCASGTRDILIYCRDTGTAVPAMCGYRTSSRSSPVGGARRAWRYGRSIRRRAHGYRRTLTRVWFARCLAAAGTEKRAEGRLRIDRWGESDTLKRWGCRIVCSSR
jgi:hypothetical protein